MSKVNSIQQMRREGDSVSEIARKAGVARSTVYKYLVEDDFSPKPPAPGGGAPRSPTPTSR